MLEHQIIKDVNPAGQLATFTTGSDRTLINIVKKSEKVVNWLGIKYIGKDTPNSVKWSYCHNGKHVLLRPGYDARQLICHNGKSFEVSCQLIQQSELGEFGPLFRCEVLQDDQTVFTFAETKPTTLNKVFEYFILENYKKNLSGYEFFGLIRPEVIQQLHQCLNKVNVRKRKPAECLEPNNLDGSSRIKRKPAAALMPYPLLEKLSKTKTRNAGPTSGLQIKSQKDRNALVHEAVQFT